MIAIRSKHFKVATNAGIQNCNKINNNRLTTINSGKQWRNKLRSVRKIAEKSSQQERKKENERESEGERERGGE